MKVEARAREGDTCPLCQAALDGVTEECRGCNTSYHTSCLSELGGCSTIGCSAFQASRTPASEVGTPIGTPIEAEPEAARSGPRLRSGLLTPATAVLVFALALGLAALLAVLIADSSRGGTDVFFRLFLGLSIAFSLVGWVTLAVQE